MRLNSNATSTIDQRTLAFGPSLPFSESLSTESAVQNVGAFCTLDGDMVVPSISEGEGPAVGGGGSGGGGDESVIPEVEFPELVFSQHMGSFDTFTSNDQTNNSSLSLHGAFNASSLISPDLSAPGLNWAHSVSNSWTNAGTWSFSESVVVAYNLSKSFSDASSTSPGNNPGSPSGAGSGNNSGLDETSSSTSNIGSSRHGFVKIIFTASQGITTASAAGVAWSIDRDHGRGRLGTYLCLFSRRHRFGDPARDSNDACLFGVRLVQ